MSPTDPIAETERLLIRPLQPADVQPLIALWTDPEVTRHLGGPRDPERLRAGLLEALAAEQTAPFDLWPTIDRASRRLVGHCGLLDKTVEEAREVELVYALSKPFWGQGYATEAALALVSHARLRLGLKRLVSLIEPGHFASARVAQKVGMQLEKTVLRPGGRMMDLYTRTL